MTDADRLIAAASELVDAISFDMNGKLIAGLWRGGNGGLISQETLAKADETRRAIAAIKEAAR
jgi:hypothetical protein